MTRNLALALAAFALLVGRFSPDWWTFAAVVTEAQATSAPADTTAIQRAVYSGHGTRGFHVLRQVVDLNVRIDDPDHAIVRWRLLVPVLGHVFRLPEWAVFGLAPAGCLALAFVFVVLGGRGGKRPARPWDGLALAIVAGATAPVLVSLGWLGYYDSLLALCLLGVAWSRSRGWVVAACLAGPWIDERFVLGLPLALAVRWKTTASIPLPLGAWLRREALLPLALASAYALVRLNLGGSGGSQTVGSYLQQFVLAENLSLAERWTGALWGLRVAWVLVAGVWVAGGSSPATFARPATWVLAGLVIGTAAIGLFSALDLSRSMVLLVPVLPLGWDRLRELPVWQRWQVGPVLAIAALVLPARHVVGRTVEPVDVPWTRSRPLLSALYNLGSIYSNGEGVARDTVRALHWYRQAAEKGSALAQNNLGALLERGDGFPADPAQAAQWYGRAADQGLAVAQNNLGILHATGRGVPRDLAAAAREYRRAAESGLAAAQNNLGILYAEGAGVPRDPAEAVRWFRRAAEQGDADAQARLGVARVRGEGTERDPREAARWFRAAAVQGHVIAQENLAVLLANGEGVARDPVEAWRWLERSRQAGHAPAIEQQRALERQMTEQERQEARRVPLSATPQTPR